MRALAPEVRLFQCLDAPESVPQRLKPLGSMAFAARVKPCPSYKTYFSSRRRKMRHTRVDRFAIVRVDSTRIIFHSINRFAKRLTSRCAWRMAWLVSCCVLIGHRVSPLFENDEVGSGRILSGGILRDNFQNIGSGFVQSLFH